MMNLYSTSEELREAVARSGAARFDGGLVVTNPLRFRTELLDSLVWTAVFSRGAKEAARHAIREAAESLGIVPCSILPLYRARGKGRINGFTVPAVNMRIMTYDSTRAALRAARKLDVGALIFEIARSEMGYTEQRPAEYAAVVLAAAIREEWQGPFFIQGDHFQTNPKKMKEAPDKEVQAIEALIDEAIPAGFLQIDIDTSTLVDLSKPTLEAQQDVNANLCAQFTKYIRSREPKAMPISIGGEIGEVGKKNSTTDELKAYLDGYRRELDKRAKGAIGLSKVSVQTGTSHGGTPLADGGVAAVALDFNVLTELSTVARSYGLSGAVQHGASTLPDDMFHKFPATGCAEIHLATGFQNALFEHPAFPAEMHKEIEAWVFANCQDERKPDQTDSQFVYTGRKKAIGPFKRQLWDLPTKDVILASQAAKVDFLFKQLGTPGSRALVEKYVKPVEFHKPLPEGLKAAR